MSISKITGLDPQTGHPIEVTVESGMIAGIERPNAGVPSIGKTPNESNLFLSAGFVDLQVNGYAGFDLNAEQISTEIITGLVDAMLANGVTSFAATLITAPEERICHGLRAIAVARKSDRKVASCIPFVHIEGPHISPLDGYRGAHPAEFVRPPSIAEFDRWQDAAGGIVGIVTLSPHFSESEEYIAALVSRGVHVAIGHTHAMPEQIKRAVDAGARLSTHLGNGIAQDIPRHRNPIWSQLADDRLSATFIADGHHLPQAVLKAMLRAKGVGRSVLVSDSVALAGMPAGIYNTPVGGGVELHSNGKLCVFGSELLAGSTASLPQCISHMVRATGVALDDALTMATVNPGRFAGGRGQLIPGLCADLVRFRWNDEVIVDEVIIEDVWLAGERVYENSNSAQRKQTEATITSKKRRFD